MLIFHLLTYPVVRLLWCAHVAKEQQCLDTDTVHIAIHLSYESDTFIGHTSYDTPAFLIPGNQIREEYTDAMRNAAMAMVIEDEDKL